tara:strand:- start:3086 stop:4123 length:1038 start_codon:yes stop_codon:yes gene_type:complete
MKNYLFELTHPKHYYQFKDVISRLKKNKLNNIYIIARDKDVLLKILKHENLNYINYGEYKKSFFSKFIVLPRLLYNYYKIVKKYKINIIVSKASPYASIISLFSKVKTIISPDSEVVVLTRKIVAPLASIVITPESYSLNYGLKHKRVTGFLEDSYLHPSIFRPDKSLVENLGFSTSKPYYILRFISWDASHDLNKFGFSDQEKIKIVKYISQFGEVYISSEGKLPSEIERFRIKIPASKIHHVLHFAKLYIGDSQTMATESALLGTPSIRYNSFVGKNDMSNFILLENKYNLLRNFNDFNSALNCLKGYIEDDKIKNDWLEKRNHYYNKVGDINKKIFTIISSA